MNADTGVQDASTPINLSWVLPLYRTSDHLAELLTRVDGVVQRLRISCEVILVDDACPDGSGALAARAATRDSRLTVLRLPRNVGQDAALRAGLRRSRGAWVVVLDADLQDPPEAVERLWPLRQDWDIVFARRTGRYSRLDRRATSHVYRAAVALVSGLPRGACLYAVLSRPVVDRINRVGRARASLLALIAATRGRSTSVPILRAVRPSGESGYTSLDRCAKAATSLWQMFAARHLNRLPGHDPETGRTP
jgi:glycosyltransferase involved in cell wall biosynthesis